MKHVIIGLDPSINCTGICVRDIDNTFNEYYIFPSKITNKSLNWLQDIEWLTVYNYEKTPINNIDNYSTKEFYKFKNIIKVYDLIEAVINMISGEYIIDYVVMEGVSYGSVTGAALVDLTFLNSALRLMFVKKNIKFYIVSPKEVKKQAIGNGNADKDLMIMSWKMLDKKTQSIPDFVKCDDLADAYFMAHYNTQQ